MAGCTKPIVHGEKGNLKRHLRRNHVAAYKAYLEEEKEYKDNKMSKRASKKPKKGQSSAPMTAANIKRNLVRLVAVRGRPLKLMDDPELKALVRPLINMLKPEDRFSVNGESVRDSIEEEAKQVRETIKSDLKGRIVSVKIDSCSRGARPFFAINVQFIKDKKVQVRTLKVKEMLLEQSAVNVKGEIRSAMFEYNIHRQNLYTVTCDSGANMILATHLITEEQEEYEEQDAPDNSFLNVEAWEEGCAAAAEEADCTGKSSCQCLRCAAHTLQLAIEHALKKCPEAISTLNKARTVANQMRIPSVRRQLRLEKIPVPSLDNSTRWNTKHDMSTSVYRLKDFAENYFKEDDIDLDWEELKRLIDVLQPCKEATVKLQSQQLLLGDFLIIWMTCKEKLEKSAHPLADAILVQMDEMSQEVLYKSGKRKGTEHLPSLLNNPVILAAIFMDPRVFTFLDEDQSHVAKHHLASLWQRIEHARRRESEEDEEEATGETASNVAEHEGDESDELESSFLKSLKQRDKDRVSAPSQVNIITKLEQYYKDTKMLTSKSNVLEFWEKRKRSHPELYELSCVVLAVPATQVSVERLFSGLAFILDPLRMSLASQLVDDILVIRTNTILQEKD